MSSTKYYFAGGEVDSHRRLLEENGHHTIAMSYVGLSRRVKFQKPWTIATRYDPATEVLLDSGAYTLNKEDSKATEEQAIALAINYQVFIRNNLVRLSGVTEFDALILGEDWIEGTREDFYNDLGDRFIPVWHSLTGLTELQRLAQKYGRAGILQDDTDDEDHEAVLQQLAADGIRLHGMGMTRTRSMRQIAWDSVSSTSWLSPIQYGDLIIWDGSAKLHRYPRTRREHGLKAFSGKLALEGFDVAAITTGDSAELLRLSAWSWSRYIDWINAARPAEHPQGLLEGSGQRGEPKALGSSLDVPAPRERVLLPLIGITGQEDNGQDGDTPAEQLLTASSGTLMRCDTCYIRRECPEHEEGAACKFSIPVQVESGNQLRAVLNTIIRIQTQRTLTMVAMEQVKGGYSDANTGAEIDRLGRLVKLRNDAEKASFTFSVTATGAAAQQAGYMSGIFGKEAGERATAFAEPVPTAEILGTIVDAEVVE
jgi:hypothetical protein